MLRVIANLVARRPYPDSVVVACGISRSKITKRSSSSSNSFENTYLAHDGKAMKSVA